MRFPVGNDDAGTRLDIVLARHLGISRSQAAARIAAGTVTVDDVVAAKGHRLAVGEHVVVTVPVATAGPASPPMPPVRYEDEDLLVVAKPAGLVVHPGPGHPAGTLVDALQGAGYDLAPSADPRRPGIVHRLDRGTSGLLIVAKSGRAREALVTQLKAREVSREYLALTVGVPRAERGRIEAPVGRHPTDRLRFAVVTGGKPSVTRYRTLAVGAAPSLTPARGALALLGCQLETGRTHQIRVHLAELGQPVAGDPVYGRNGEVVAALRLERMFLHARRLAFQHPVTGRQIVCDEGLPEDLAHVLVRAGIDSTRWEDVAE